MSEYIKITFLGDLMCLKEQLSASQEKYQKYSFDEIFDGVANLLQRSDYVAGTLETPVAGEERGYTSTQTVFNTPEEFLDSLKKAGLHFLSTANNHCLDKGIDGLRATLDNIKQRGLDTAGTYKTKEESDQIFVREIGGLKVAFLCFTYGTNSEATGIFLAETDTWMVDLLKRQATATVSESGRESCLQQLKKHLPSPVRRLLSRVLHILGVSFPVGPQYIVDNVPSSEIENPDHNSCLLRLAEKIRNAKSRADIVIVMPHMGGQFNPEPGPYAKYIMEKLIALNVDAVVAGHPHTPHICKRYPNGAVGAFSLGNFCFTPGVGWFVPNALAEYGIVLNLYFDKALKRATKATFSVVKSVVDVQGYSKTVVVHDLLNSETPARVRDLILAENEAIVNRVRGTTGVVAALPEYELWSQLKDLGRICA
jgi:poly-gamma-glutamate capsule biosynthesis protein CapA/YwtB (metallophosphatase superfamily)